MCLERYEVRFVGRVQGVGFRYTTKRIAAGFDVTGSVKNLPNGQVLLIAEGKSKEIEALLQTLRSEMQENIDDVQIVRDVYQGAFDNFEITH